MTRQWRYRIWAALLLMVAVFAGCAGEKGQTYEVRGIYIGPDFQGEAIKVDHEAIPGYMDAMEMSFKLRDRDMLTPIKPGDKIRFTLLVSDGSSTVQDIEKLPDDTPLKLSNLGQATPDTIRSDTSGADLNPADTTGADSTTGHAGH